MGGLVQGGTIITHTVRPAALLVALVAAMALAAPAAFAANRYASPTGTSTGDCTLAACPLTRALQVAAGGDSVLLAGGDYSVDARLTSAAAIEIRPEIASTRPRLVGTAGLAYPTLELTSAGVVKGLQIETSSGRAALQLAGGSRGIGLVLFAGGTGAVAARLVSDPARTALLSSLARTTSSYTAIDAVDPVVAGLPGTAGHVSMVNVTAIATGTSSWGVTTDLSAQSPVLKNAIVRATAKGVHGRSGTQAIAVSSSNFVSSGAANWTDAGGNQADVAVTFAGEADLDYHVLSGSPVIDAGAGDPLLTGTNDPDGRARVIGAQPDIGAYEFGAGAVVDPEITSPAVPPGDSGAPAADTRAPVENPVITDDPADDTGLPLLPPAAPPVLAERVGVAPASGTPLVKLPGSGRFVPLSQAASIPVGSIIDATKGHVELTSVRDTRGTPQTGEFWGGVFVVRQARAKKPYTEVVLTGGSFRRCPSRSRGRTVARAAGSGKMRGVVRKLWGKDKAGRFRTRGKHAVATVRGTIWVVEDRCDGTMTRVREGAVVVKNRRTGKTKLVRAGKHHLVRSRRR